MSDFTRDWVSNKDIKAEDKDIAVMQVYVWVLTQDEKVILVSKNGRSWQFPGGKPNAGETLVETAVREVQEETGLDIANYASGLEFFGYYRINEPNAVPSTYLQIR